jgi:hypothetical protein
MRLFWVLKKSTPAEGPTVQKDNYLCAGGNPEADEDTWCKSSRTVDQGKLSNLYTHVKQDHGTIMDGVIQAAMSQTQPKLSFKYNPHVIAVHEWLERSGPNCHFTAVEDATLRKVHEIGKYLIQDVR